MSNINKLRKNELIKSKLSTIIRKSSSNPLFDGVTIVDVKLSPDSASAIVGYSIYRADSKIDEITKALNKAAGFFQVKLSKTLDSRNTPKLKFIYDGGFDHATKIDQLLSQIKQEKDLDT